MRNIDGQHDETWWDVSFIETLALVTTWVLLIGCEGGPACPVLFHHEFLSTLPVGVVKLQTLDHCGHGGGVDDAEVTEMLLRTSIAVSKKQMITHWHAERKGFESTPLRSVVP